MKKGSKLRNFLPKKLLKNNDFEHGQNVKILWQIRDFYKLSEVIWCFSYGVIMLILLRYLSF